MDRNLSKLSLAKKQKSGIIFNTTNEMEKMMSKKVLVPLAEGTEEVELTSIVDILRRAGADVTVAAVDEIQVTASRGMKFVADVTLSDVAGNEFDLIVLPGGMPGAQYLCDSDELIAMLKKQEEAGRLIGAICASPFIVLEQKAIAKGCQKTCYPSMIEKLTNGVDEKVVVDQYCITSQGPGTALAFAVKLVELLFDKAKADKIAKEILL